MDRLQRVFVIAEIGVNHNGSIEIAKRLITEAKKAGADAVKFQTFTAESLVSHGTPKVKYQRVTTDHDESHFDMIKSLELSRQDHLPLIEFCEEVGITFISTPYDVGSAEFLDKLGVEIFKTASADITDFVLHEFLASTGKPVIISTGMATMQEIEEVLRLYDLKNSSDIYLLHCVSNYPCSYSSLNLNVMTTLKEKFGLPVGYSDHAVGPYPAVASVALGAQVIEKHFTLDKDWEGPDHRASSTPDEFAELVLAIRTCEASLGSSAKEVQAEEMEMRKVSRKSIFLSGPLSKGEEIDAESLTLKRPGTGLYARHFSDIIGRRAIRDLPAGHMLALDDLE